MEYNFKTELLTKDLINWVKSWFSINGNDCNAVIGISGGKDSTICAKLCVEALGKDRVYGVLMPNGEQHDYDVSKKVVEYLGIKHQTVNIKSIYDTFLQSIKGDYKITEQTLINLAPRIRMVTLRAICQSLNGRLVNTSNLSEDWIGYATIDGDSSGDFSPLSYLTVEEVKKIGHYFEIPDEFVDKKPEDGLTGLTDEDKFGFKYSELDGYIRGNKIISTKVVKQIEQKFNKNLFKLVATKGMTKYCPDLNFLYTFDNNRFGNLYNEINFLNTYNKKALPPCFNKDPRSAINIQQ